MARRALIVGAWQAPGRERPTPQKVRSLTERWVKLFAEDKYGFRALTDPAAMPLPLHNPKSSELLSQLEEAQGLTADTELLLYFLGHSVSDGENDLKFILGTSAEGKDRTVTLSWLLTTIRQHTPVRKLVVILDTCHAGRARETLRLDGFEVFAMFATGDAYAFEADFSDGLLRSLEQPVQKNDQRIDRRAGGITYRKIFEATRRRVMQGSDRRGHQEPRSFGDYANTVVLEAPIAVPAQYNAFASSRSIYARVFRLLQLVDRSHPTIDGLRDAVDADETFLLRRYEGGRTLSVSTERLMDYVEFLRKVRWLIQPEGQFRLTPAGQSALDDLFFNRLLLDAIEAYVFNGEITFDFIDRVVKELLSDMIPPTPVRIKDRAAMKGVLFDLDAPTRLALQLLPSTGQFLKGSADAIYPSELFG